MACVITLFDCFCTGRGTSSRIIKITMCAVPMQNQDANVADCAIDQKGRFVVMTCRSEVVSNYMEKNDEAQFVVLCSCQQVRNHRTNTNFH